ncbi:MAG: 50S ribosomal protein L9 [Chloroflexota bacterium]
MKVIFIEDVPNVADIGETKEVKNGYGRNYLLPRKLAVLPGSHTSHLVAARLKVKAQREAQTRSEMEALAQKLNGQEITVQARAGTKDRLYGSITSGAIAEELSKLAGQIIDKRKVELDEPIRQLGTHEVEVKLYKDVTTTIKITVVAEDAKAEESLVEAVLAETEGEAAEAPKKEKKTRKKAKAGKKTEETPEAEAAAPVAEAEAPKPEKKTRKKAKAEKKTEETPEAEAAAPVAEAEAPKPEKKTRQKAKAGKKTEETPEAEAETAPEGE